MKGGKDYERGESHMRKTQLEDRQQKKKETRCKN